MGTLASELQAVAPRTSVPRVYADANIPVRVVDRMRRTLGWDVFFVLEHDAFRRARDRDHFVKALEFGRTIITLDHDFCDDSAFPPALSPGVIVCSAANEDTLTRLLQHIDGEIFRKAAPGELPLRGRKLLLAADVLSTI